MSKVDVCLSGISDFNFSFDRMLHVYLRMRIVKLVFLNICETLYLDNNFVLIPCFWKYVPHTERTPAILEMLA